MDVEKLIETLRQHGVSCVRAHGRYCSICDEAATALSTLQAENEKLRAESIMHHTAADNYFAELTEYRQERNEALDELEQVKRERDDARATLDWFRRHGIRED